MDRYIRCPSYLRTWMACACITWRRPARSSRPCAYRLGTDDVVLKHELRLDPGRHMGGGKRFSPEPVVIDDEMMATLLGDIMETNPEQRNELAKIRSSFSVTAGKK